MFFRLIKTSKVCPAGFLSTREFVHRGFYLPGLFSWIREKHQSNKACFQHLNLPLTTECSIFEVVITLIYGLYQSEQKGLWDSKLFLRRSRLRRL